MIVLTVVAVVTQFLFSQSLHDGFAGGPTPRWMVELPCFLWGIACIVMLIFLYLSLKKGRKQTGYFVLLLALCSAGLYISLDEFAGWASVI